MSIPKFDNNSCNCAFNVSSIRIVIFVFAIRFTLLLNYYIRSIFIRQYIIITTHMFSRHHKYPSSIQPVYTTSTPYSMSLRRNLHRLNISCTFFTFKPFIFLLINASIIPERDYFLFYSLTQHPKGYKITIISNYKE